MNKFVIYSTSALSGLLLLTGCGDDDDGAGAGAGAVVPTNAIVITEANAETTVETSVTSLDTIAVAVGVEATPMLGLKAVLVLVKPQIDHIKDTLKNSGADPVYGVAVEEARDCYVSGTYSFTGDEDGVSPSFTSTGTATLVDCDDGDGYVLNGTFSWSERWNIETWDYSDSLTGFLNVQANNSNISQNFTGVSYSETGNEQTELYEVTKAAYSVDYVTDGVSAGGFLVNLDANIIDSSGGWNSCPESGHIAITGGNGSTADGIYNGDDTMTIKANGEVVNAAASCYY